MGIYRQQDAGLGGEYTGICPADLAGPRLCPKRTREATALSAKSKSILKRESSRPWCPVITTSNKSGCKSELGTKANKRLIRFALCCGKKSKGANLGRGYVEGGQHRARGSGKVQYLPQGPAINLRQKFVRSVMTINWALAR